MPLPDYQGFMLPLLQELEDGSEHALSAIREGVAAKLGVSQADREAVLPSGKQSIFGNRLGWAKTYMERAGLLRTVRRAVYELTERGRSVLAKKPVKIDTAYLLQFPEFQEFKKRSASEEVSDETTAGETSTSTPQESLDAAYQQIRRSVEADLLAAVR